MHHYLTNRYQRVQNNNSYIVLNLIKHDVPQGSILGSILFNTFLCDLFLTVKDKNIASSTDENSPYYTTVVPVALKSSLKKGSMNLC